MKTRIFYLTALFFCFLGLKMNSQTCTSSFTYTLGASGQISLTSTSSGVNGATKYNWYLGNGNVLPDIGSTVNYTYPYNGTYHVTLFITDTFSTCYDSTSINIIISNAANTPCLAANYTYTVSGAQASFTLTSPTPYNRWDFGDGATTTNNSTPLHNYSNNGTYSVACYTQYQYGSSNVYLTCDTFYQSVAVTSVPCLAAFNAHIDTMYNSVVLYNTSNGADSIYYSVNGGAYTNVAANWPDSLWGLPAGTNTICQRILGNGCVDSVCQTINISCLINVTYNQTCSQLTFNSTSNQTITTANWYIGGNLVSTQINPVITYSATPFYVKYSIQAGTCQKTDSVLIQTTLYAAFSIQADTAGGQPIPHSWIIYAAYGQNTLSYLWNWGDGTTSNTAYPTHNYSIPGLYNICLTVKNSCGDSLVFCQTDSLYKSSSSSTMIGMQVVPAPATTGITSNAITKPNIYPVPANDYIVLENLHGVSRVEVFDNEGRKVLSEQLNSFENKSILNIQSLAQGFYILKIYAGNNSWQKKIIKQ